ncbi:hypothetical protein, conserved [Babesia bigemina]|uniref:Uncharacterized protein n=1 Tax=Babesia bigemina TaxID=5866 RepID=A0A061BQY8_BABBI|nr:hypothetical protein, conserved [Babesia bigemina]CDR71873.1 hypothetical protein, conserved [Babesia bigemina]|eukprot:XP_012770816.1 hypothetical protein, conserved [Babesia bigemina]
MAAAPEGAGNKCGCKPISCQKQGEGPCASPQCTQCKTCCDAECNGCKVKCKANEPCKCYITRCGCKDDCYANGSDGHCRGLKSSCERCKIRCQGSPKCICHYCSCGTKCNGVICSCCSWCDPRNCSGVPCNGYVIGKCPEPGPCKGHVKYDIYDKNDKDGKYGAVYNRNDTNRIPCDKKPHQGKDCTNNNCNWLRGERNENGCCIIKCTYCGTLCGQDKFRRCCYIAIPVVIIVLLFLIFRFMLPEKFHAITTKIRAAFPTSPRHHGRSFTNLVGDRIPEEVNIDRYPAFRPRAYAGLA